MYKIVFSPTGYGLVAKPLSEYNFNLSKEPRQTLISGEQSDETTDQDKVIIEYTPAVYKSEEDVVVTNLTQNNDVKIFESVDPEIATIDQNGRVTRVTDGSARIIVTGQYLKKGITVDVSETNEASYSIFDRWADGSLAKNVTDIIDTRIVGKDASAKNIFSTQNHTSQIYVRNTNCWAYGLDLTCISPWNSTGANTRAGTLISPRHIIFAKHYQISTGATVRFVMSDGTVVNRIMTAKQSIDETDITIGVLDSDVPAGISFAKIMPLNWVDYAPNLEERLPTLALDQQEKALINDINSFNVDSGIVGFRSPIDPQRSIFYEDKIGGDSGNPAFLIINNELAILTCWWFGGAGSGPNISYFKDQINSIMTSLGGGYQLTEIDLSSFTNFS